MALIQSLFATGALSTPTVEGADVAVYRSEVAAPVSLAVGDILEMGALPADHLLADLTFDATSLDSNATKTINLQFGFLNAAKTDLETVLASTQVARAGGIDRVASREFLDIAPLTTNRALGFKVQAAAATKVAGEVGVTVYLRSA